MLKSFDIPVTSLSVIILTEQRNYICSDLYLGKFYTSAKLFFPGTSFQCDESDFALGYSDLVCKRCQRNQTAKGRAFGKRGAFV